MAKGGAASVLVVPRKRKVGRPPIDKKFPREQTLGVFPRSAPSGSDRRIRGSFRPFNHHSTFTNLGASVSVHDLTSMTMTSHDKEK